VRFGIFGRKKSPKFEGAQRETSLWNALRGGDAEFRVDPKLTPSAPGKASRTRGQKLGELGENFSPNYFTI